MNLLRSVLAWWRRPRVPDTPAALRRPPAAPAAEPLEDRCLLAVTAPLLRPPALDAWQSRAPSSDLAAPGVIVLPPAPADASPGQQTTDPNLPPPSPGASPSAPPAAALPQTVPLTAPLSDASPPLAPAPRIPAKATGGAGPAVVIGLSGVASDGRALATRGASDSATTAPTPVPLIALALARPVAQGVTRLSTEGATPPSLPRPDAGLQAVRSGTLRVLTAAPGRSASFPPGGGPASALTDNLAALPGGLPGLPFFWANKTRPLAAAIPPAAAVAARMGVPSAWADLGALAAQAFYLSSLRPAAADGAAGPSAPELPGDTRLLVADLIRRSTEAFTRLVRGFFETFLGRPAAPGEEAGWVALLLHGHAEEQVLSAFLATEEFGQRAVSLAPAATADESFVEALHGLLLGRRATEAELGGWLTALPGLGRAGLAGVLLGSAEYRRLRVAAFFEEFAGRPADEAEVAAWADSPFPLLAVRQFFETRPELFR